MDNQRIILELMRLHAASLALAQQSQAPALQPPSYHPLLQGRVVSTIPSGVPAYLPPIVTPIPPQRLQLAGLPSETTFRSRAPLPTSNENFPIVRPLTVQSQQTPQPEMKDLHLVAGNGKKTFYTKDNQLLSFELAENREIIGRVELTDDCFKNKKITAFCECHDHTLLLAFNGEAGSLIALEKKPGYQEASLKHACLPLSRIPIVHISDYKKFYLIVLKNGEVLGVKFLNSDPKKSEVERKTLFPSSRLDPDTKYVFCHGMYVYLGQTNGVIKVLKFNEDYSSLSFAFTINGQSSIKSVTAMAHFGDDRFLVGENSGRCSLIDLNLVNTTGIRNVDSDLLNPVLWSVNVTSKVAAIYVHHHLIFIGSEDGGLWYIDSRTPKARFEKIYQAPNIYHIHVAEGHLLLMGTREGVKKFYIQNLLNLPDNETIEQLDTINPEVIPNLQKCAFTFYRFREIGIPTRLLRGFLPGNFLNSDKRYLKIVEGIHRNNVLAFHLNGFELRGLQLDGAHKLKTHGNYLLACTEKDKKYSISLWSKGRNNSNAFEYYPENDCIFLTQDKVIDFQYLPAETKIAVLVESQSEVKFRIQHASPKGKGKYLYSFTHSARSGPAVAFSLESDTLYLVHERTFKTYHLNEKQYLQKFSLLSGYAGVISCLAVTTDSIYIGTSLGDVFRCIKGGNEFELLNSDLLNIKDREIKTILVKDDVLFIVTHHNSSLSPVILSLPTLEFKETPLLRFELQLQTETKAPAIKELLPLQTSSQVLTSMQKKQKVLEERLMQAALEEKQKAFRDSRWRLGVRVVALISKTPTIKKQLLSSLIAANFQWQPNLSLDTFAPVIEREWSKWRAHDVKKEALAIALADCLHFFGIRQVNWEESTSFTQEFQSDLDFKRVVATELQNRNFVASSSPVSERLSFPNPDILASTLLHIKLKELLFQFASSYRSEREPSIPSFVFQKNGPDHFIFFSLFLSYDQENWISGFNADLTCNNSSLIKTILNHPIHHENSIFQLTNADTITLFNHIKQRGLRSQNNERFFLIPAIAPSAESNEESTPSNDNSSIETSSSSRLWLQNVWSKKEAFSAEELNEAVEFSSDENNESDEVAVSRPDIYPHKERIHTQKQKVKLPLSVDNDFLSRLGVTHLIEAIRKISADRRTSDTVSTKLLSVIPYPFLENFVRATESTLTTDYFLDSLLKPYQKEAVLKLLRLQTEHAPGGILGLEMGLGKTIIAIEFMAQMADGPILFISPKAVLGQTVAKVKSTLVEGIIASCRKDPANAMEDLYALAIYLKKWRTKIEELIAQTHEIIRKTALNSELEEVTDSLKVVTDLLAQLPDVRDPQNPSHKKRVKVLSLLERLRSTHECKEKEEVQTVVEAAMKLPCPVLFITMEQLTKYGELLKNIAWETIFFDEAQKSENEKSQLSLGLDKFLEELRKNGTPFLTLLSGTVFQNQVKDYLNLMIHIFGSRKALDAEVNKKILRNLETSLTKIQKLCDPEIPNLQKADLLQKLYQELRACFIHLSGVKSIEHLFLQREYKNDPKIAEQWPNKPIRNPIPVPLTPTARQQATFENLQNLYEGTQSKAFNDEAAFLNWHAKCQLASIHPDLIDQLDSEASLESKIEKLIISKTPEELEAWIKESALLKYYFYDEGSPLKVKSMEQLEPTVIFVSHLASGHALVKLISKVFQRYHPQVVFFHGKTKNKDAVVKAFNAQPIKQPRILIATWRSGGVGLDLIAGKQCHALEPDFNPAVTEQGVNRIDRVGVSKLIDLYSYVFGIPSYEERFNHLITKKDKMGNWVLPRTLESPITLENASEKLMKLFDVHSYGLALKYFTDPELKAQVADIRSKLLQLAAQDDKLFEAVQNANPLNARNNNNAPVVASAPVTMQVNPLLPPFSTNNSNANPWPVETAFVQYPLPEPMVVEAERVKRASSGDSEPAAKRSKDSHP